MKKYPVFLMAICFTINSFAQQKIKWYEPEFVEGVCITDSTNIFNRLPVSMKEEVRPAVWDLSQNNAGEFIHFKTTASKIEVRYTLSGKNFALPHMPSTGMSGVDLFAKDVNGNWNWAPGKYSFGDTCTYLFSNLFPAKNSSGIVDFYLYLPLYNSVKWLSLGVSEKDTFSFADKRQEKPIVIYGTSITQGGVTSRPGLCWTSILSRNIDRTIINLAFSGNGKYEAPIFDLMAKVDAKLYILDCMPNLGSGFTEEEIKKRLVYGVNKLRERDKTVPILFIEHSAGYAPFFMDTSLLHFYRNSSQKMANIFEEFKTSGLKDIYLLTDKEIGFDINSTVDAAHPNDIGMMKYAIATEKKLREILNEPVGTISTQIPVEQYRDGYDWIKRQEDIAENMQQSNPDILLIGNSIIHYFGGKPAGTIARGEKEWNQYLTPLKVQNSGFGWDRIENVLWRIYHGGLDHFKGQNIVLMIGTNNMGINTNEEIVEGLQFLIGAIKSRKPFTKITMVGILPRKNKEPEVRDLNLKIKKMAQTRQISYVDFGKSFLNGNLINSDLFERDGLHPNTKGYEVLGKNLHQFFSNSKK